MRIFMFLAFIFSLSTSYAEPGEPPLADKSPRAKLALELTQLEERLNDRSIKIRSELQHPPFMASPSLSSFYARGVILSIGVMLLAYPVKEAMVFRFGNFFSELVGTTLLICGLTTLAITGFFGRRLDLEDGRHFADRFAKHHLVNWKYQDTAEWVQLENFVLKMSQLEIGSSDEQLVAAANEFVFHESLGLLDFIDAYNAAVETQIKSSGDQSVAFEFLSQMTRKELEARYLDRISEAASGISKKLNQSESVTKLGIKTLDDCSKAIASIR